MRVLHAPETEVQTQDSASWHTLCGLDGYEDDSVVMTSVPGGVTCGACVVRVRVREAIDTSPVDHIVTKTCAAELTAHIVAILQSAHDGHSPLACQACPGWASMLAERDDQMRPAPRPGEPPRFDEISSPARRPGDPLPSLDGRLWRRVVFGDDDVCAAEDVDGVLTVWDEAGLFEVVFRAPR